MKFKVGDRVKVTNSIVRRPWLQHLAGTEHVIKGVYKCANPEKGCYDIGEDYIIPEEYLTLIGRRFEVGDRVKIVASTCGQTNCRDCVGGIYTITAYNPALNAYSLSTPHDDHYFWRYEELELINMKKEFTKKDLRNGDYVKVRDGDVGIVLVDIGAITFGRQYMRLNDVSDDLITSRNHDGDIMAVCRPNNPLECTIDIFDRKRGELVYERKEVEEMTLEEVCKALGKEIKIVKNKD